METKPYNLQAPESIAKEYGGNKQKIAQAVQMGIVNPTAALLAGMFIDRMRNAAPAEQAPTQTVAEEVFSPQPAPSMPTQGLAAMQQPQMPQGMPPQGMPPQGMPPQGLAAMQQTQMPSMASGGVINYAEGRGVNSGNPFSDDLDNNSPDLYESRNKFDYEIEALKKQLRDPETDDRRGLAERLKQITMGDPAIFSDLPYDSSLIEFGERNRDLLGLKERARERVAEGTLSNDQFEAFGLEPAIGDVEYGARSRIQNLEKEIAEREAKRQSAVTTPDNFQMSADEFDETVLGSPREIIKLDEKGEVPGGLQSVIDFAPVPGEESLGLQSEGNIGLQAPKLQSEPGTLLDPQSYPGAPEELTGIQAATSDYEKLQEMLGKSKTDEDMTKEAVQARADKEKREDTLTALAEFGFRMAASDSPYFLQAAGEAGAGTAPTFKDAISRSRTTVEDARKERKATALSARAERIELLKEAVSRLSGKEKAAAEKELKQEEFSLRRELKGVDKDIARIYKPEGEKSESEKNRERIEALVREENPDMDETQVIREAARIAKGASTDEVDKYELGKQYRDALADEQVVRNAIVLEIDAGGRSGFTKAQNDEIDRIKEFGTAGEMEKYIEEILIGRMGQKSYDSLRNLEKQYNEVVYGIKSVDDSPEFRGVSNDAWGVLSENENDPRAIKEFAEQFGIPEADVIPALKAWRSK